MGGRNISKKINYTNTSAQTTHADPNNGEITVRAVIRGRATERREDTTSVADDDFLTDEKGDFPKLPTSQYNNSTGAHIGGIGASLGEAKKQNPHSSQVSITIPSTIRATSKKESLVSQRSATEIIDHQSSPEQAMKLGESESNFDDLESLCVKKLLSDVYPWCRDHLSRYVGPKHIQSFDSDSEKEALELNITIPNLISDVDQSTVEREIKKLLPEELASLFRVRFTEDWIVDAGGFAGLKVCHCDKDCKEKAVPGHIFRLNPNNDGYYNFTGGPVININNVVYGIGCRHTMLQAEKVKDPQNPQRLITRKGPGVRPGTQILHIREYDGKLFEKVGELSEFHSGTKDDPSWKRGQNVKDYSPVTYRKSINPFFQGENVKLDLQLYTSCYQDAIPTVPRPGQTAGSCCHVLRSTPVTPKQRVHFTSLQVGNITGRIKTAPSQRTEGESSYFFWEIDTDQEVSNRFGVSGTAVVASDTQALNGIVTEAALNNKKRITVVDYVDIEAYILEFFPGVGDSEGGVEIRFICCQCISLQGSAKGLGENSLVERNEGIGGEAVLVGDVDMDHEGDLGGELENVDEVFDMELEPRDSRSSIQERGEPFSPESTPDNTSYNSAKQIILSDSGYMSSYRNAS
jgi:hypothetical protein